MNYKDPKIPLQYAIAQFKNQARLAAVLGISKAMVSHWIRDKIEIVPAIHAYRLLQIDKKAFKEFKVK